MQEVSVPSPVDFESLDDDAVEGQAVEDQWADSPASFQHVLEIGVRGARHDV